MGGGWGLSDRDQRDGDDDYECKTLWYGNLLFSFPLFSFRHMVNGVHEESTCGVK